MTTPPGLDDRHRVCAVCARVLDVSEGHGWMHTVDVGDDHIAVPVLASEVRTDWRCDFCFTPELGYLIPARDFMCAGPSGYASAGPWCACLTCGALILRDEWSRLTARALTAFVSRYGPVHPGVAVDLRRTYRRLRAAINGPLRKVEELSKGE